MPCSKEQRLLALIFGDQTSNFLVTILGCEQESTILYQHANMKMLKVPNHYILFLKSYKSYDSPLKNLEILKTDSRPQVEMILEKLL